MEDWDDLLEFLKDARTDVRKIAAQNVRSYTQSAPHLEHLEKRKPEGVKYLCNLLGDEPSIAGDAVQSLINVTATPGLARLMVQYSVVERVMHTLGDKADPLAELKLILLSNLTGVEEEAVNQLLQLQDEDLKGLHIARLMGWFLHLFRTAKVETEAVRHVHWVLPILANASGCSAGQELLLEESPLLDSLPPLLATPDVIIRGGATRLLKNLVMDFGHHPRLVEAGLPLGLLRRLQDGEEPNKDIRRLAAEALVLLSRSEVGVGFFDGNGGKAMAKAAAEREVVPDIRDMLQMVVDGLEDVQDAYVMEEEAAPAAPTPTPPPAPTAPPKDADEQELELPE